MSSIVPGIMDFSLLGAIVLGGIAFWYEVVDALDQLVPEVSDFVPPL